LWHGFGFQWLLAFRRGCQCGGSRCSLELLPGFDLQALERLVTARDREKSFPPTLINGILRPFIQLSNMRADIW
jgi:hypothetical protein